MGVGVLFSACLPSCHALFVVCKVAMVLLCSTRACVFFARRKVVYVSLALTFRRTRAAGDWDSAAPVSEAMEEFELLLDTYHMRRS